jgi:predicted alpha/beta-hydrolase family hydrolase
MTSPADLKALGAIAYPADPATAAGASRALLVLAHGAGAGQTHPFMVATARGLSARGLDVVTFDFPYMARGRGGPDRPPVLEQSFRDAVGAARAWSGAERLFIGGKSMGGRMATHLGAQHLEGLSGIVVLGYPLHPPGKPDQLRVAHLPSIAVPLLIVQGERDPFGAPDEFTPHLAAMRAEVTLHVVAGGDHSLTVRGAKGKGVHDAVMDTIAAWVSRSRGQ